EAKRSIVYAGGEAKKGILPLCRVASGITALRRRTDRLSARGKRKAGCEEQSGRNFAKFSFYMIRRCAKQRLFHRCLFHRCFPSVFGCPFRVMFVIRHLFPEIRDEVPENFRNRRLRG